MAAADGFTYTVDIGPNDGSVSGGLRSFTVADAIAVYAHPLPWHATETPLGVPISGASNDDCPDAGTL